MQLESPPIFEQLLLESPWAVMVVCVVVAAILFSAGRRRRSTGLKVGGMVALGLAAGVFVLAKAVTTPREQLMIDTRALVAATAPLDRATLDRLIDPTAVVTGPSGAVWVSAGNLRPKLNQVTDRIRIDSQQVRMIDAVARDEGWGESVVTVRTEAGGASPVNTSWRLTWRRDPGGAAGGDNSGGGWRVVDIRWMLFNGMETPQGVMP